MLAAVLHAPGDLRVERVPAPLEPKAGEVIVRVMAAGVCGSDIGRVMKTGTYRFPTIPGHEFAGVVERLGEAVDDHQPGDPVAVAPLMPCFKCPECAAGHYSLCDTYDFMGSRSDGGFAEFLRVPARNLLPVPRDLPINVAATIEPAAIILHGIQKIDLSLGDAVAVIGCGALGFFAVQFAKLSGAQPLIAIDIDDEKLALAAEAGADLTINPTREDVAAGVRAATEGRGVHLAIEAAGSNAARDLAIGCVRKQGTVLLYGSAYGDVTFKGALFEQIIRHEIEIVGSWNSYSAPFPGREWRDIISLLRVGRLKAGPLITHVLALEEAPRVFRALADRSFGRYHKIIFAPNG